MKRSLLLLLPVLVLTACRDEPDLFRTLDVDQDQGIALAELEQGIAGGLFKTYDADRDGVITTAEWRRLDPEGDPVFMRQRDGNRDGRITRDEALKSIRRRPFSRQVFQQADRNRNGSIEPAEAEVWFADHPEIIERLKIGD
jgi:EF hand